MINFNFKISNLWSKNKFNTVFSKSWSISKNKNLEVELIKHGNILLLISFNLSSNIDHAGVMVELGLFGYYITLDLRDKRHWSYTYDGWIEP